MRVMWLLNSSVKDPPVQHELADFVYSGLFTESLLWLFAWMGVAWRYSQKNIAIIIWGITIVFCRELDERLG